MDAALRFDPATTALLAMDCQTGIVTVYAKPQEEFIERTVRVLRAARMSAMPVIFVQVAFRPGFPEVGTQNKLFSAIKCSPPHQSFFEGASGAIHPAFGPEPVDVVVTKHRVSAFAGTDLEVILRANRIDTLVLFGIATSGVVLSTLLDASDADYRIFVIEDCCADLDAELHDALLKRLFPRRADVITSSAFLEALSAQATA